MNWNEPDAIESHLRSLKAGMGLPSQKELDCLERAKMWEETAAWAEELESAGGGLLTAPEGAVVDCRGYRRQMTPWQCLENQLSLYCLPGWPCETCEEAAGIVVKGKSFHCVHFNIQVHQGLCVAARTEARRRQETWPEGMGWLENCLGCDINLKVGRSGRDLAAPELGKDPPSGTPALNIPKAKPKRLPAWLKDATPAVRRDYGF